MADTVSSYLVITQGVIEKFAAKDGRRWVSSALPPRTVWVILKKVLIEYLLWYFFFSGDWKLQVSTVWEKLTSPQGHSGDGCRPGIQIWACSTNPPYSPDLTPSHCYFNPKMPCHSDSEDDDIASGGKRGWLLWKKICICMLHNHWTKHASSVMLKNKSTRFLDFANNKQFHPFPAIKMALGMLCLTCQ